MNLGKLVRAKMKELAADLSGEYVDNQGKHFAMAASDDGYSVTHGGDKKMTVSKEDALKLARHCRRLEAKSK